MRQQILGSPDGPVEVPRAQAKVAEDKPAKDPAPYSDCRRNRNAPSHVQVFCPISCNMRRSVSGSCEERIVRALRKNLQLGLCLILATLAAASMWFYVDRILVTYQVTDAAEHDRPRGNLSDLYPRWLGARELLLHGRNPYSQDINLETQKGYYGRALDASRPDDPKDQQGFAYPVYVVFILAPLIGLSFHDVQIIFGWLLIVLTAGSVLLWLGALRWRWPVLAVAIAMMLTLGSVPAVQGIKLQQLSLLVAALLAASGACVASGYLFCGGALLALATIKPQLAWPVIAWLLVWALSDWKARRRLLVGFAATMGALLIGAEIVLPGWWRMFLQAIRQYHQYTHNESVLDQLFNWMIGRFGGDILAALSVLIAGLALWTVRKQPASSAEFGRALALVLALTVLIVPMYAPYNQVLLLPAILSLVREWPALVIASRAARIVYAATALAFAWQWIATIALTVTWFASPVEALKMWKLPFYATFTLPVLVFVLALLSANINSDVLRFRKMAE